MNHVDHVYAEPGPRPLSVIEAHLEVVRSEFGSGAWGLVTRGRAGGRILWTATQSGRDPEVDPERLALLGALAALESTRPEAALAIVSSSEILEQMVRRRLPKAGDGQGEVDPELEGLWGRLDEALARRPVNWVWTPQWAPTEGGRVARELAEGRLA